MKDSARLRPASQLGRLCVSGLVARRPGTGESLVLNTEIIPWRVSAKETVVTRGKASGTARLSLKVRANPMGNHASVSSAHTAKDERGRIKDRGGNALVETGKFVSLFNEEINCLTLKVRCVSVDRC